MKYTYANPTVKKHHMNQIAIEAAIEEAVRILKERKVEASKQESPADRQRMMLAASQKYIEEMEAIHKKQQ